jgi:peptidyl-prolyl cis-trans isomerase C
MNPRVIALAFLLLPAGIAAQPAAAQSAPAAASDPVVARVDGAEIRQSEVLAAIQTLPEQYRSLPVSALFTPLLNRLIEGKLLAGAAEKAKLADEADVKVKLAAAREQVLRDVYLGREIEKAVSADRMRSYYQALVKSWPAEDQIHARHILVKTEKEAQAALDEVKKSGDFAEVAKKRSTDGSAPNGGDLGYFTKEQMVPQFSEAAFALKKGEVSAAPFVSPFGWHIVKVEDRRPAPPPSFEDKQDEIRDTLAKEAVQETLAIMRKDAKIEQFDVNGAAPPAMQLAPRN